MEKTGVPTGAYAVNPLSREKIPIWVTNYVLAEYGTGAVMGVPAHDERDFEFARKHGLPIAQVITTPDGSLRAPLTEAYVEDGKLIASGEYIGMKSAAARRAIAARLEAMGRGKTQRATTASATGSSRGSATGGRRSRSSTARPTARSGPRRPAAGRCCRRASQFTGQGSPLANDAGFMERDLSEMRRPGDPRPDTMDTFVDSSWYYVRYLDAHERGAAVRARRRHRGGCRSTSTSAARNTRSCTCSTHASSTCSWSTKGYVTGDDEPFTRLFNQGMLLAYGEKMSKSRGNVVGIDEAVEKYGVDAMRLFLLKAAPPEDTMDWTEEGIIGRVRFVQRVWRAAEPLASSVRSVPLDRLPEIRGDTQRELVRALHVALDSGKSETETHRFHYNVTTAKLDELVNQLTTALRAPDANEDPAVRYVVHALPIVLAPFAPHLADELWARMGYERSVHLERWIEPDPAALAVEEITLVVQVNGKVRARIQAAPGIAEDDAFALAMREPTVDRADRRQAGSQAHLRPRQAAQHRGRIGEAAWATVQRSRSVRRRAGDRRRAARFSARRSARRRRGRANLRPDRRAGAALSARLCDA